MHFKIRVQPHFPYLLAVHIFVPRGRFLFSSLVQDGLALEAPAPSKVQWVQSGNLARVEILLPWVLVAERAWTTPASWLPEQHESGGGKVCTMDALLRQPIVLPLLAVTLLCFEAALNQSRSARTALIQLERTNQKLYDLDGPSPLDPPKTAWKRAGHGTTSWMESREWRKKPITKGTNKQASPAKPLVKPTSVKGSRKPQQLAQMQSDAIEMDPLKGRPDFAPLSASLGAGKIRLAT
jgi:hypothetical protein